MKGISYNNFLTITNEELAQGRTSGHNHSASMLEYTKLNSKRMVRQNKTIKLSESLISKLQQIKSKQYWVVLVEAWCGDVAQNVPAIAKMTDQNENIALSLLYRDENIQIIDNYLTNGARAIPKLIIFDEEMNELATWGPRPQPVQQMLIEYKSNPAESYEEYARKAHTWYAKDRNETIQKEISQLLDNITLQYRKVA